MSEHLPSSGAVWPNKTPKDGSYKMYRHLGTNMLVTLTMKNNIWVKVLLQVTDHSTQQSAEHIDSKL